MRRLLQREVADEIGVSPSTVQGWEKGTTTPTPRDGPAIVRFLGYLPLRATTLAERLYTVRFGLGLSQAEAADRIGVSEDSWGDGERGFTLSLGLTARIEAGLAELETAQAVHTTTGAENHADG